MSHSYYYFLFNLRNFLYKNSSIYVYLELFFCSHEIVTKDESKHYSLRILYPNFCLFFTLVDIVYQQVYFS